MLRYHLTLERMASTNKSGNGRYWQSCEEKGTLLTTCGNVNWYGPFRKPDGESLNTDPILLAHIYPEDTETLFQRDRGTLVFIAALFTTAKE